MVLNVILPASYCRCRELQNAYAYAVLPNQKLGDQHVFMPPISQHIRHFIFCNSHCLPKQFSNTRPVTSAMGSQHPYGYNNLYTPNLGTSQHVSYHSHMSPPSYTSMNPNVHRAGSAGQPRPTAEDNTQPRFELFLLGEGEKKVTEEADTREFSYLSLSLSKTTNVCCFYKCSHVPRISSHGSSGFCLYSRARVLLSFANKRCVGLAGIPSSSIFTFNKEDHTLGNLLRSQLLKSPHVRFAGYKVPHPLVR